MSSSAGAPVADTTARYLPFGDWRTEPTANLTDRGYTSHKHNNRGSDDIGLIYMNARYYVPGIARFASADSIIPNPANPQSYNRYSYVRNNPLNFVDPTGHRECEAGGIGNEADFETCQPETKPPNDSSSPGSTADKCQSLPESCGIDAPLIDAPLIGDPLIGDPLTGAYISGNEFDPEFHLALDLKGDDKQLLAIATGTVVIVDYVGDAEGYFIIVEYKYADLPLWLIERLDLKSDESLFVQYQHMAGLALVSGGDIVSRGDVIGIEGNTGHSDGEHLHLEIAIGTSGSLGKTFFGTPYYGFHPPPNSEAKVSNNRLTWDALERINPNLIWDYTRS